MYKLLNAEVLEIRQNKPFYLEAYTYRWKGHVGHRDDIDVGVKRGDQLTAWKERDPIKRLFEAMKDKGIYSEHEYELLLSEIQAKINNDWNRAELAKFPGQEFLLKPVYSN
jgi:pyruvate dehydrogenase E1 component alpha subunit